MHSLLGVVLVLTTCLGITSCSTSRRWLDPQRVELEEVATSTRRWTGLAISRDERIFVNYPLWSASQEFAVGELQPNGEVVPYPDTKWNSWQTGESPEKKFVCVQALLVDGHDRLWVLDPANPRFEGVVEGGPKLVCIDLTTNGLQRVYRFGPEIAPRQSYLNDLRIDLRKNVAYLTDSGDSGLVVLDLATGEATRRLDDHPSTHSDGTVLSIDGEEWTRPDGTHPEVHADGIALSRDRTWVYYQALTGQTLYRVSTSDLLNRGLDDAELGGRVEKVGAVGPSDGLLFGRHDGYVYLTSLERNAIRRIKPGRSKAELLIEDDRISWPDSMARGPDDSLYFTTAQIHRGNNPRGPFAIYRIRPSSQ